MYVFHPYTVPVVSFVESNVTGGEGDVVKLRVKRTGSIRRKLRCKVRIESTTAEKGVCACVRVCVRACVRACVRVCVHACVCMPHVYMHVTVCVMYYCVYVYMTSI